jgi:hypothetical protein
MRGRMKSLSAVPFVVFVVSNAASAGDFSEPFNRVQQVWNNVTSFQAKAWQAINDTVSSTSAYQVNQVQQNFWNNTAPQEITDASKIAFTQIFPQIAEPMEFADKIDQYASQWASQAQTNAQTNLNSLGQKITDPTSQLGDYFGASSTGPTEGGACAVFTNHICPPCPFGGSMQADGNCPVPGLESGGSDDTYLSQSGGGLASGLSVPSDNSVPAAASSQTPNSITAADLASIGASKAGATPSTSLSADAQQLPGQLATWDQQQAAEAQARAAAAQRAQEEARRRALIAQAKVQAAAIQQAAAQQSAPTQQAEPQPSDYAANMLGILGALMQGWQGAQNSRQLTAPALPVRPAAPAAAPQYKPHPHTGCQGLCDPNPGCPCQ